MEDKRLTIKIEEEQYDSWQRFVADSGSIESTSELIKEAVDEKITTSEV